MMRTTHQPSRIGTRYRLNVREIVAAVIVSALAFILTIVMVRIATDEPDARVTVHEGDRVCVAMMGPDDEPIPDAYYCGPLTLTTHDDIEGDSR